MVAKPRLRCIPHWLLFVVLCLGLANCRRPAPEQVVIYTSVDQVYAEPILKDFEQETGIRVLAVYDVEATKTVGLSQRLIAEKSNPQADVFWNGEFLQTLFLKAEGVLDVMQFPFDDSLPRQFIDPEKYWVAFGGRARVILVNTDQVDKKREPSATFDLLDESFSPDLIGMANPLFGTTSTEAAALYTVLGRERAYHFYQQIAERGVRILDGNSVVRDQVASGQLAWGLTDTDDACGAIQRGAAVKMIFPNQGEGELGTLIIPNTVARVAGGPNPKAAEVLLQYLLRKEVEARLVEINWIQVPSRPLPPNLKPLCPIDAQVRGMEVGFDQIAQNLETTRSDLRALFIR